ncbi:MAG: hypothetical protein II212_05545, partial [Alistipes sp.]|nr:hypothetical protein [Alistipes sp.]
RYHRNIYSNGKQLALLNRDIGLYTLNLEGGRRLAELGIQTSSSTSLASARCLISSLVLLFLWLLFHSSFRVLTSALSLQVVVHL